MRPYLEMFERLTPDSVLVSHDPGAGNGRPLRRADRERRAARTAASGMILDGNLRDIEGLRAIGFPVFYRDLSPLNGIGRWEMTASQQPIAIGGVTVHPGDIVFAEFDGDPRRPARGRGRPCSSAPRTSPAARAACATEQVEGGSSPWSSFQRHGYI